MNVLALLKVIESYNEIKSGLYFFCNKTKTIRTNTDNCDRKSAEKNF